MPSALELSDALLALIEGEVSADDAAAAATAVAAQHTSPGHGMGPKKRCASTLSSDGDTDVSTGLDSAGTDSFGEPQRAAGGFVSLFFSSTKIPAPEVVFRPRLDLSKCRAWAHEAVWLLSDSDRETDAVGFGLGLAHLDFRASEKALAATVIAIARWSVM